MKWIKTKIVRRTHFFWTVFVTRVKWVKRHWNEPRNNITFSNAGHQLTTVYPVDLNREFHIISWNTDIRPFVPSEVLTIRRQKSLRLLLIHTYACLYVNKSDFVGSIYQFIDPSFSLKSSVSQFNEIQNNFPRTSETIRNVLSFHSWYFYPYHTVFHFIATLRSMRRTDCMEQRRLDVTSEYENMSKNTWTKDVPSKFPTPCDTLP